MLLRPVNMKLKLITVWSEEQAHSAKLSALKAELNKHFVEHCVTTADFLGPEALLLLVHSPFLEKPDTFVNQDTVWFEVYLSGKAWNSLIM